MADNTDKQEQQSTADALEHYARVLQQDEPMDAETAKEKAEGHLSFLIDLNIRLGDNAEEARQAALKQLIETKPMTAEERESRARRERELQEARTKGQIEGMRMAGELRDAVQAKLEQSAAQIPDKVIKAIQEDQGADAETAKALAQQGLARATQMLEQTQNLSHAEAEQKALQNMIEAAEMSPEERQQKAMEAMQQMRQVQQMAQSAGFQETVGRLAGEMLNTAGLVTTIFNLKADAAAGVHGAQMQLGKYRGIDTDALVRLADMQAHVLEALTTTRQQVLVEQEQNEKQAARTTIPPKDSPGQYL